MNGEYIWGMKYVMPLAFLVVLGACGGGQSEAADQQVPADTTAVASLVVDLAPHDVPFSLDLGDAATLGVDRVAVRFNEEFGWLEVRAGEHFALTIAEEPGDLARLKADLERDMLQRHSVVQETSELLVYRSQFPDEDLTFVHFQRIVTLAGRTFVVRDAQGGRLNEADVTRMAGSIRTQQPA